MDNDFENRRALIVIAAYNGSVQPNGTKNVEFWCAWCHKTHHHGYTAPLTHRRPHCHHHDSIYNRDGYYLVTLDDWKQIRFREPITHAKITTWHKRRLSLARSRDNDVVSE